MAELPYAPRPGQRELVAAIAAAQASGGALVAEAGTGTGKTICALTACATVTATDHRRVVYATRTNSQQSQVCLEHGELVRSGQDPGLLLPFMGRRHYCPLLRTDARFRDGTPEELGKLCRDAKSKAQKARESGLAVAGACPFYARLLEDGPGPVEALLAGGGLDGPALGRRVEEAGSCPYEALKLLMPKARIVVVPFVFVIDDRLRRTLLEWMGVGADEVHAVLDEAHNLPDAVRDHHSPRLSVHTLKLAQAEAEEVKDPPLAGTTLTTTLLDALLRTLYALVDEHVRGGEDGLVPPGAVEEALMVELRAPSTAISRMAAELEHWGEVIREDRRSKGRLPRSYLGAVGSFLRVWMAGLEHPTAPIVAAGDNPALELVLLDPASVMGWMQEYHSTVQMSGTLAPLDAHARLSGVPAASTRVFPSPFDPSHLRVYGWSDLYRSHQALQQDPTITERQQAAARAVLARLPGRTGLFFPSHAMLRDYLEEGFLHACARPMHVERPDMASAQLVELVARFKSDTRPGPLLLGVLGGRLTEGIDFPGDAMEALLVMGVPYPRPGARTQAIIHHFDARNGDGWQVAVHTPVGRVLRQAIGRLIRGPDDRGTAVVLDARVARFRTQLPHLEMVDQPHEVHAPAPLVAR